MQSIDKSISPPAAAFFWDEKFAYSKPRLHLSRHPLQHSYPLYEQKQIMLTADAWHNLRIAAYCAT